MLPCLVCRHHNPDPDKAGNGWMIIHCIYCSLFVRLHPRLELEGNSKNKVLFSSLCFAYLGKAVLSNNRGWQVPVLVKEHYNV